MRKILTTTILIILFSSIAIAIPQFSSEKQNRPRIELIGNWLKERVTVNHTLSVKERTKKVIAKIEKEAGGRYLSDYNDTNWTGHWHYIPGPENPPPDRYEGGVWYRRKFTVPSEYKDKLIRLQFEGVNYIVDVWINGKWIGSHEGGYTPFGFDITLKSENTIAVRVDNIPWDSRNDIVPYKTCDWWNYGGITRDVYIEICEDISIANAYITRDKAKVVLLNYSGRQNKTKLKIKIWDTKITNENIIDPRPDAIIDRTRQIASETKEISFSAGEKEKELNIKLPIKSPKLWSPQKPNLYVLELSLDNGDIFYTQFGIREIKTKASRLFLNDKLIYLNGTARHEVFGQKIQDLYNDLKIIKEMNVNFLRTAHYPNEPELYILADRIGILVWEEIPVYWFDSDGFNNQLKRKITDLMWVEMIKRDFNRPSIIFWGTCNECSTQVERSEFIKRLYVLAYSIDGTRLIGQSASGSDPLDMTHGVCDIIGVTMYYGIFYGKDYYKDTLKALDTMHSVFPEKPILVTEYGTWSGLDLSLAGKQVKVASDSLKAFLEKPYVVGWTWWCVFDWYSMITTFQTMGTITIDRNYIKPIYYYLQKIYGNKISPLEVEILEPYNYATVRGIVEIKTKIEPSYKIEEVILLINNQNTDSHWDTTRFADGEYIIYLKAKDSAGVTQTSIKKVFVDNIDDPPLINVNIKDGDWIMHTKNIQIQLTDDRTPPMDLKATLTIDGEEKELLNPKPGKFFFKWDLTENATHILIIKASDTNKNISEKTLYITVDNSPGTYIKLPYNHDWISWDENMSDGTGWDFPAEELPESNLDFIYNKTKFMFGDKTDGKVNNIECSGQRLAILLASHSNLYILASSHDGSSSGDLVLIYDDNSKETITITISDWWGAMPMFGEELTIKCTHHHERNAIDNPPGAGIYLRKIILAPGKNIKEIILPNEPKLHIFSITLE